jgi:hypothetical protein
MVKAAGHGPAFYGRLAGSLFLFGLGALMAFSGRANFNLGSRKRPVLVDATGLDAIAIGCVFIGLAVINLALGIRGPERIKVFWSGAAIFLASLLYGLYQAVQAIATLFD